MSQTKYSVDNKSKQTIDKDLMHAILKVGNQAQLTINGNIGSDVTFIAEDEGNIFINSDQIAEDVKFTLDKASIVTFLKKPSEKIIQSIEKDPGAEIVYPGKRVYVYKCRENIEEKIEDNATVILGKDASVRLLGEVGKNVTFKLISGASLIFSPNCKMDDSMQFIFMEEQRCGKSCSIYFNEILSEKVYFNVEKNKHGKVKIQYPSGCDPKKIYKTTTAQVQTTLPAQTKEQQVQPTVNNAEPNSTLSVKNLGFFGKSEEQIRPTSANAESNLLNNNAKPPQFTDISTYAHEPSKQDEENEEEPQCREVNSNTNTSEVQEERTVESTPSMSTRFLAQR